MTTISEIEKYLDRGIDINFTKNSLRDGHGLEFEIDIPNEFLNSLEEYKTCLSKKLNIAYIDVKFELYYKQ